MSAANTSDLQGVTALIRTSQSSPDGSSYFQNANVFYSEILISDLKESELSEAFVLKWAKVRYHGIHPTKPRELNKNGFIKTAMVGVQDTEINAGSFKSFTSSTDGSLKIALHPETKL